MIMDRIQKENRLAMIMKEFGFAVWQLQELEWALASLLVLRVKAKRGIGKDDMGNLFSAVEKRTFGSLLKELCATGVLKADFAKRLETILADRNWLIHRSRHESRGVLTSPVKFATLITKIRAISNEALFLLKHIGQIAEEYVIQSGVSMDFIDREAERLLIQWGILEQ